MSTFGKVLAVLNVLAAIGFLALSAMDYNKRQGWAFAHYRAQLAVHGLPLDKDDDSWRLPGRSISEQLGKDARKQIFNDANGPATQVDAVNAIVAEFKRNVEGAAGIDEKRKIIAQHLLPQLTTAKERDDLIRRLQTLKPEGVDSLVAQFDVIASSAVAHKDLETRRRAIADFLYAYEYNSVKHNWVQGVVGLEQYVAAAERQVGHMRTMIARDLRVIKEEQAAFITQYQVIPPELTVMAGQLQAVENKLKEQQEVTRRHEAIRNARMAEVMEFNNKISTAKQAVQKEEASLSALQSELFQVQQDWARYQARNQQLESELRLKAAAK